MALSPPNRSGYQSMSQLLTQALQPLTEPVDLSGLAIPHPNPFLCSITINTELLSETIAHVSNIQYVALIDRAAELAADAVGYSRNRLLEEDRMWFVGRHEIDYRQEATVGQTLFIATWVRDIRRVKSWRETLMFLPNPDPSARSSKPGSRATRTRSRCSPPNNAPSGTGCARP